MTRTRGILSLLVAAFAATHLFAATPSVASVTAQQRYPWNGKVDIAVTFSGASNEVAKATCTFAATNSATGAALAIKSVTEVGTGPVAVGTGPETWMRRYVWDATADVGEVQIPIPNTHGISTLIQATSSCTITTTAMQVSPFVLSENLPNSARIVRVFDSLRFV